MDTNIFNTFSDETRKRLLELGIKNATKVQNSVIPKIRDGKNTVFQSETGTGKTFAYLLPLLEKIEAEKQSEENVSRLPKILIIAPTLELTSQIKNAARNVTDMKISLLTGNAPLKRQIEMLKEKPEIICGTAGRLLELIKLQKLKTSSITACVLDEADRLLKKESVDLTYEILRNVPKHAQLIACSATITNSVKKLVDDFGKSASSDGDADCEGAVKSESKSEYIEMPAEDVLRKKITHIAIYAEARDKIDMLCKFMRVVHPEKMLVFASRQAQVINIAQRLQFRKLDCDALFSKQDKFDRKTALDDFRSGVVRTLVTSDLSARGLDIAGVTHVVQMDLPEEKDFFVHRAGRTARAGESGMNVVIGDAYEMRRYAAFEKQLGIIVYPKILYGGKMIAPDEAENYNS